ncbi:DUF4038 domain-containing protein [Microlunatus spumicola]|uniref:DUF4038 domain-containing protein n=1 Tax=Microlunatus spumicola TaxID=81499 RepID=A0ABP6XM16_9ACTN
MTAAPRWRETEIVFTGPDLENPYVEVEAWVDLVHASGETLRRPVFWDGCTTYRVRFASTWDSGAWRWTVGTASAAHRLEPASGVLEATRPTTPSVHPALDRGFPRIAPGARAMTHPDGSPAFLVADTAWALPFRATLEDVATYAADRAAKHFTAVLLMTVQPDMGARGPRGRDVPGGFEVGFEDLPDGHLNQIVTAYWQHLDRASAILVDHGLTPVLVPVFHGFGWKGLGSAGPVICAEEYARFCRYLVARYGARPAVYLVGADGTGEEQGVEAGGEEIERWDAYGQPVGIHHRPHSRLEAHQDAPWLDFRSCQTGHDGDHVPDRLATMWMHRPVKAIMNGEPTYENSGRPGKATGWWQGHEAWSNVCAGGLLGVAYGAGSLWQWRLSPEEEGHPEVFLAEDAGWREALDFEGSRYVGLVGHILRGLPLQDAAPCWDVLLRSRGLLVPGRLFLSYAEHGGPWVFLDADGRIPDRYWVIDPRTGRLVDAGTRPRNLGSIPGEPEVPMVLICADEPPPVVVEQLG